MNGKLEGSQICSKPTSRGVTADGVSTADVVSITSVVSKCCSTMASVRLRLLRTRMGPNAHRMFLRRTGSAPIMSEIRSGREPILRRIEIKHHPRAYLFELFIDEELKGPLLALHNVFTMVGVKKMSSSCFATASVFCLKSHPKSGTRER